MLVVSTVLIISFYLFKKLRRLVNRYWLLPGTKVSSSSGSQNHHFNYPTLIFQNNCNYKYLEIYTVQSSLRINFSAAYLRKHRELQFYLNLYKLRSDFYVPKRDSKSLPPTSPFPTHWTLHTPCQNWLCTHTYV